MRWFDILFNILFGLIALITGASAFRDFQNLAGLPPWGMVILILASIAYIFYQIKNAKNKNIFRYDKNKVKKVNDYLLDWLNQGSKTVIFTRNFSWANEPRIEKVLIEKARNDNLTVCLHAEATRGKTAETIKMLEQLGAEIYIHNIKSRFIIIDHDTHHSKVNVGRKDDKSNFVNERFYQSENPAAYHVFLELFELVKNNHTNPKQNSYRNK